MTEEEQARREELKRLYTRKMEGRREDVPPRSAYEEESAYENSLAGLGSLLGLLGDIPAARTERFLGGGAALEGMQEGARAALEWAELTRYRITRETKTIPKPKADTDALIHEDLNRYMRGECV